MIARNERMQIRKRLAQQHMKTQVAVARNVQKTLNAILYQIIIRKAEKELGEIPEGTFPTLVIPIADLQAVPVNFGLTLKAEEDDEGNKTISVSAILVKPKSNIILPGGG